MTHETQVRLVREIFRSIDRGAPPLAEASARNDPAAYTSRERAAREREVLFRGHPLVVAFSSQLRNTGDFVTEDLGVAPILVVRTPSGAVKAFANVCRHRGSRLAGGCGSGAARFACPYHGWSYDLEGRLRTVPDEFGFADVDRDRHGLIELPSAEQHGLVWVAARPDAVVEVDELLGGLGAELAGYRLDALEHVETRVLRKRMNWKLVSDTFWEAYHLKVLHKKTIAPLFLRNIAIFEPFGPSHRYVGVRTSIESLRGLPEERWDLIPHATILMNLFPNTIVVMQSDHVEAYRVFPGADCVNECRVAISVLAAGPAAASNGRWQNVMDMLVGVVEEDFAVGETIQRSFESGVLPHVVYGRFEDALDHFHRSIRDALGASSRGGDDGLLDSP